MKKVEALIQPYKLMEVKEALAGIGLTTLTVSEVRKADRDSHHTERYRGQEYTVDFTPQMKLEIVVSNGRADEAIAVITAAATTGDDNSGTISISHLDDTFSIQHGKRATA